MPAATEERFAAFARECAGMATGRLGWAPALFWDSTYAELRVALHGRLRRRMAAPALGGDELRALKELLPDG